jgi:hypothetical protein
MREDKRFKGLPVHKESHAHKVSLPNILIHEEMETYSGWDYLDHVKWVRDITKLPVLPGMILATNEECSEVWLLSNNHYHTRCRLIYSN